MKRVAARGASWIVASVMFFLLAFATIPVKAESERSSNIVTTFVDTYIDQASARSMLDYINKFREGKDVDGQRAAYTNADGSTTDLTGKLQPLVYDYGLEYVATLRATEIALRYSHYRPNGEICFSAWEDAGFLYGAMAENIAAGDPSAYGTFVLLREDGLSYDEQGHRRNMLSSDVTRIGIGHVVMNGVHYWAQAFGSEDQGSVETEAYVGDASLLVPIDLNSLAGAEAYYQPLEYQIVVDEAADLPDVLLQYYFDETWPYGNYFSSFLALEWETDDMDVVAFDEEGYLIGTGVGTTNIHTYIGTEPFSIPVSVTIFRDVRPGSWYYDDVMRVYQTTNAKGSSLMSGYADGSHRFGSTNPLSRQDFAVILYRLANEPEVPDIENPFTDTDESGYYYSSVLWAKANDVIAGYNDGRFGVGDKITREQVATILYRFAKDYLKLEALEEGDLTKFNDGNAISSWAEEALTWATGAGIITGKSNGTLIDARGNAARAEIAAMILRFMDYIDSQPADSTR